MTTADTKRRIIIQQTELVRMGFGDGEDVTSHRFTERLNEILDLQDQTRESDASAAPSGAPAVAEALLAVEAACDEGLDKLTVAMDARLKCIEAGQAALLEHVTAIAALPKWFDVYRSETLNFMHHILKENAGLRQLLDRLTATDPDEIAELKTLLDGTCQDARRVLKEREADYQDLYSVHEEHLLPLRLLEGAAPAQGQSQDLDRTLDEEMELEH